jgi:hypothetical protein
MNTEVTVSRQPSAFSQTKRGSQKSGPFRVPRSDFRIGDVPRWAAAAVLAVVLAISVPARADVRMELIGSWGGSVDAVCIQQSGPQTLAYVGSGVRMFVLDVTDPANVVEVGRVLIGGVVRGIQVRDGYAFVASNMPSYFCVVNVADPAHPVLLSSGNQWMYGKDYGSLLLRGNMAYAVQHLNGEVEGFDISNPLSVPAGQKCICSCADLAISSDYSYEVSACCGGWLAVRDLSVGACWSPQPPLRGYVIIPELYNADSASLRVAVNGSFVYVTSRLPSSMPEPRGRIVVADFSTPTAPVHVGTWGDGAGEAITFPIAAAVSDGRLYVVDWTIAGAPDDDGSLHRALLIFDIATDPASPALLGEYWSVGSATDLTVVGTTVYLCDEREGLLILDCSDPANVTRVGGWYSPAVFHQGLVDGQTLYVADRRYGVTALDVADPRHPQLVSKHETGGIENWGLAKRGDSLYVVAGKGGLQVLDVADPAAPVLAGAFPFAGPQAVGLALYDDDVYGLIAAVGVSPGAWLVNFAVDNPQNIVDVGEAFLHGAFVLPRDVAVSNTQDGITYVPLENLRVAADISDPANPFVALTSTGSPWHPYGACVEGSVLYVTASDIPDGTGGLYVFDVSDPSAQTQLAFYHTDLNSLSVAVQSQRAYLGGDGGDLRVFDVSNPAAPSLIAWNEALEAHAPSQSIEDIVVDGPVVYALTSQWDSIGAGVLVYLVWSPGDFDADRDVDLADFAALQACFTGAGIPLAADAPAMCRVFDFNADGDVDAADFAAFIGKLTGCNPPPAGPTGACCLPDGSCEGGVTAPDCTYTLGGQYQGNGTTCDNVICPPTGACCLPYGSAACVEWTQYACLDCGGTYYGDDSDCSSAPCPFGACCNPDDGTCTEKRPSACAASGGVYQGDATTCATTTCPWGKYANTIDPMTSVALAGTGLMLADDLTLAGTGARDLTYLDLRVFGNGGGAFNVTVELWTACPGAGGTLIPNTTFTWTGVPDDSYVHELIVDPLSPPVTIPDTVWMVATFSTPQAGWIIAGEAETGTTANIYGRNSPPWACNRTLTGTHAGLWANLQCVVGESKARGEGETRLGMQRVDSPADIEAVDVPDAH